jgi:hypothetical protein
MSMNTAEIRFVLTTLFAELTAGPARRGEAYVLNSGDAGLLRSLDLLSADDASTSMNEGATIAAHAQHLRYGLSLMNRWADAGGDPFADALWDEAWRTSTVTPAQWADIRAGLRAEVQRWQRNLDVTREVNGVELTGMVGSIAHLAYHLGAIRQIGKPARGPKEGTFNLSPDRPPR